MIKLWNKIKNTLKFWLLSLLVSVFFVCWVSFGANDLLRQIFEPTVRTNNMIDMWENVNRVWQNVFEWSVDISLIDLDLDIHAIKVDEDWNPQCEWENGEEIDCLPPCSVVNENNRNECEGKRIRHVDFEAWGGITKSPSIIVKVTRLLLILIMTLSITMILYNWMRYIVETWSWKEWKNLVKNIIYIVIWIIIALFSAVIITVIQSVPETIDQDVRQERNNETDNQAAWDRETIRWWWSYRE